MAVKKKVAKKAAKKTVKRPRKKTEASKNFPVKPREAWVKGKCKHAECDRAARTSRSKWCDFHNRELRLAQFREAGRNYRRHVKQNKVKRRSTYGGRPTKRAAAGKLGKGRPKKKAA